MRLRWGHEEKYKDYKSKLEIERFVGIKKEFIYQEIYANVLAQNLAMLMSYEAREKIESDGVKVKHKHKIRKTSVYSRYKKHILELLLKVDSNLLSRINEVLKKDSVPIRDGRKYERKSKPKRSGFFPNKKPI